MSTIEVEDGDVLGEMSERIANLEAKRAKFSAV